MMRASMRSADSSSSTADDPRDKLKDCLRNFVAFMCTQVGVGGLVVCYAICGAFGFVSLETNRIGDTTFGLGAVHAECARRLWTVTSRENILDEATWRREADAALKDFQSGVARAVLEGYDGRTVEETWSFPAALMYCLSVFTMIGYGNLVPRTPWGKAVTVLYACLGIPIYVLYFMNMGRVLATTFKWIYSSMRECGRDPQSVRTVIPTTACLWVISFYILFGAITFAEWENWNYLDATYFCVTSLCKIGIGDFVPGVSADDSRQGSHTKLVINFLYMLLGMGLIAMCYYLMKEEVTVKWREFKDDARQCFEDVQARCSRCIGLKKLFVLEQQPSCSAVPYGCFTSEMPPIRLCSVPGYDRRANDVVFCPAAIKSEDVSTVVYFGGDVQDFPEVMKSHKDNKNYLKWNLENMATLLNMSFPHSHILIVRPSKIEYETFSCYKNFVPSGNAGVPEHTPTHFALQHLERLLQEVSQRMKSMSKVDLKETMNSSSASRQFYSDVDILQVSIETLNSKLKRENETVRGISDREIEGLYNNVSSNSDSDMNSTYGEHHVTITSSSKKFKVNNSETSEGNSVEHGPIALSMGADDQTSSVVVSSQCQSTIVANPHSTNSSSRVEVTEENVNASNCVDTDDSMWWHDDVALDKTKLILIGFSKGCVVLNQFIYEFHYLKTLTPDDVTMCNFVSRITDMFWLDGGHAGGKNTWITSRSLLETLTRLGVKVWVHVTPYQVQDERRAWIRREEHTFTDLLQKLGAQVTRTLHFDGATPDLHMHFDILSVFRN